MSDQIFTSWGAACNVERLPKKTQANGVAIPSYRVTQAPLMKSWSLDSGENAPGFRKEIDFSLGPFHITGYLDTDRKEVGITVSIMGIGIGDYHFSFDQGVDLSINLLLAKGSLKFYISENSLIMSPSVKITFDGSYEKDIVIVSW